MDLSNPFLEPSKLVTITADAAGPSPIILGLWPHWLGLMEVGIQQPPKRLPFSTSAELPSNSHSRPWEGVASFFSTSAASPPCLTPAHLHSGGDSMQVYPLLEAFKKSLHFHCRSASSSPSPCDSAEGYVKDSKQVTPEVHKRMSNYGAATLTPCFIDWRANSFQSTAPHPPKGRGNQSAPLVSPTRGWLEVFCYSFCPAPEPLSLLPIKLLYAIEELLY